MYAKQGCKCLIEGVVRAEEKSNRTVSAKPRD